jgi:hypothetical protein
MNAIELLAGALKGSEGVALGFLADLSDADLLVRPVPGANHIAWQIGHLTLAERFLVGEQIPEVSYPPLPAGFETRHGKEAATSTETTGWLTKAEYERVFRETRAATVAAVSKLTEADLDRPTQGRMAAKAPKLGNLIQLLANHDMMHAGQFSVVRRKQGKPVLF